MCKQCSVEINYFLLDIKNSKRSKTILSLKEKYKFFIKNVLQPVDPLNQSKSGVGNFFSRRARFTKNKFFAGHSNFENFYFKIKKDIY